MKLFIRIITFYVLCMSLGCSTSTTKPNKVAETYLCIPCGHNCDKEAYKTAGECTHCKMPLVKKSTISFKTIEPNAICNYIAAHPNVVLLDVRTREEFEGKATPNFGTLKNAINLPIQELENKLATLSKVKEKEIVVYCSHSHRSPRAAYILTQNGFTNVSNLAGGMSVLQDSTCKK
jgi:rhodanese-related sulfurtransferase/DNA-directed RNA polymerase subunit RPC12/RpoP